MVLIPGQLRRSAMGRRCPGTAEPAAEAREAPQEDHSICTPTSVLTGFVTKRRSLTSYSSAPPSSPTVTPNKL